MSEIACLGWGSLVWRPEDLKVRQPWLTDGPRVCVEFLRQSEDGRITLVLDASAAPVQACWAMMETGSFEGAVRSLAKRETGHETWTRNIAVWKTGDTSPRLIPDLQEWAAKRHLDGVVWTNLGAKFAGVDKPPKVDEVVTYLKGLTGEQSVKAQEYVRRTPPQVATVYRRRIEEVLAWTPQDAAPRMPG